MIQLLAFAALTFSPMDQPIEPIESDLIELGIETGLLDEMCGLYGDALPLLITVLGDTALSMDIIDSYAVRMFEQGYSDTARLTVEAEAVYLDHLHTCI